MLSKVDKTNKLLEEAVSQFSSLPGIGRKTAFKLVLHLLKRNNDEVIRFSNSILHMKEDTKICEVCANISDEKVCHICSDISRDKSKICIVENIQDIMVIESTMQFNGIYHVLGGVISPIEGISPGNLNIQKLLGRIENDQELTEIIFALPTTMEGDTTSYYLFKKIEKYNLNVTSLARGVAIGEELQYADELTLGQSILNRKPFSNNR
jgi:recombination protein RecR